MNLGRGNPESNIWARFQPNLTTYAVPTDILTAVGGHDGGGATVTARTSGFDAPDLYMLMARKSAPVTRTPTRPIIVLTASPSRSSNSSPGLNNGAIGGIAAGCGVAFNI